MAFNDSSITFGAVGLQGESVNNPTAIDFSKSGKPVLFVTQQNGEVWRFEIEREADDGDGDTLPQFVVTDALKISDIKLETQNYNDDGTENSATNRQTTGLVTTTDANGNDVLYVNSSDWRIAVGNDSGLDTNSGQVHKIVLDKDTGAVISNVAIIRGLPRSEENHSTNGLDLSIDPATGDTILWIAQGGNTNKGAPGNNFAGTVDFALSGTVLKVNLTELEAYDIRTDGNGDQFILDLPTLNDPGRADIDLSTLNIQNLADAPNFALDDNGTGTNGELNPDWAGGNNGLNMAKIASKALVQDNGQLAIVDNPLSVHQPGHRNNYDVVVTQNGEVFSWDNGPNGGWGGQPLSFSDGNIVDDWTSELATNQFNESGSGGFGDQLTYAGETTDAFGPYAGDANPIRAAKEVLEAAFNPDGTYKPANSSDPVLDQDGVTEIFANETEARDYLSQLVMVWEEQGNGNWVNATPANLPADIHDIVSGYDWNHPGNSLSDPTSYYPQNGASLMDGTFFSPESELLPPGQDGSLKTVGASTNGLAEYTGTFFGGALNGAVIGASFNGNLYFEMPVDTDGDGRTDAVNSLGTINGFGSQPLGVTAVGDEGFSSGTLIDTNGDGVDDFAGLVIAATYGADNITFFVPGGTPADPSTDLDLDGLDNTNDSHIGDPLDGKGVTVGADQTALWDFEPNNPASTPAGAVPPGSSIAGGIGVNAVLRNGTDVQFDQNGPALYDPTIWNLGGASSFVSIDGDADTGSAEGSANDQADVLGIGFAVPSGIGGIKIAAEMNNIFDFQLNKDNGKTWDGGEKAGLIVGPGNQSTFVQATTVAVDQGGTVKYGLELLVEEDDTTATPLFVEVPGLGTADNGSSDGVIELEIDIDLSFGAEAASARVRFTDGGVFSDWFETGTLSLPADVVSALKGQFNNLGKPTGAFV
ncbi:MAG TPA: hypothetical protein VKA18_03470, partial [Alphaproteobacteria bacterium]|nr:hypothetical protein [Alphaproteobacteria bacterium]